MKLKFSVKQVLESIVAELDDCPDLIRQTFAIEARQEVNLFYFEGLGEVYLWTPELIRQLLAANLAGPHAKTIFGLGFPPIKVRVCTADTSCIPALLAGETVLLAEGLPYGIAISAPANPVAPSTPANGRSIYGTQEGFRTRLDQNMPLLRRAMVSSRLKFKVFEAGEVTGPKVVIAYLQGTTAPHLIQNLSQKIQRLQSDSAAGPEAKLEEALKDFPDSPFPQYQITEQVTQAVTALQEGRMAVLCDGQNHVWLTPANFFAFFRTADDLHIHWLLASGLRLFRIAAVLGTVIFPGLYIAFTAFHYQFLSRDFLIALAQSRTKVPMDPVVEVILMELILTVFYELGARLSSPVSLLIGIFGGLSITGGLLATGLVSNVLIIFSVLSLLLSFLIPVYHLDTIRGLRCLFIIFSGLFGVLGVAICASLTFSHLLVLETLGQPYLEPVIPFKFQAVLSTIVRIPRRILPKKSPSK